MSTSEPTNDNASAFEVGVERSHLLQELSIIQGVVERKTTIPVLSHLLLETSNNHILITGTDLDVSMRTMCEAHVTKPGHCLIPARKVFEYVRLLPDGKIAFKALPNHWVQIRSGRSHTKIAGLQRANFPQLPQFPTDSVIRVPAATLRSMITKTMLAVSTEESRYTLNGALWIVQEESMTMVATDGHRLAHIQTKAEVWPGTEMRVLVPKKALTELYSLLNLNGVETVEFAQDSSSLFFRIGDRLLTSRQLFGNFPNFEAVLPKEFSKSVTFPTLEFARALQRVSQFADPRSSAVRLKIEKNQLKLSSSDVETGESEETLETVYAGDPLTIGFNSRYLLEFAKVAHTEQITFKSNGNETAGEFRPAANSNSESAYRYVVMPMRT